MDNKDLIGIINEISEDNFSIKLQLVYKNKNNYNFLDSNIKNTVQKEIVKLLKTSILSIIKGNELVDFDPISREDETIEKISVNDVKGYEEFKLCRQKSINYAERFKDLKTVSFYVLELNNGEKNIKIFRRYSKNKTLSKGILFKSFDKTFDKIKENIFQVDENVDFISIDDNYIIIFNRYSFELITGYRTNYTENLKKALEEIRDSNLVDNVEQFCEDCKNSIKIAKRFTKAMKDSSIRLILENLEDVEKAIKEAELSLTFRENKVIYEGKEQLHDLVKLLSDEFAKTLIGKRIKS
ncbi:hypothetical protein UMC2_23711 [[Clostridium] sordellii]|uniref:Kiwa anti-phage protein KwaB-like domain-containing protein n=1 Tax=Paraclostridium sordellii TaxID=1505 RepID=UPI000541B34D|nr:Kiwa anti-phage protein KwaB-like domain-containing protein [Paeniclostridium sordellii]CEK35415.1 hypothetical protein UMC2_23711 [[Clostridium] sordellii] [Paeniclostridium sordellii]